MSQKLYKRVIKGWIENIHLAYRIATSMRIHRSELKNHYSDILRITKYFQPPYDQKHLDMFCRMLESHPAPLLFLRDIPSNIAKSGINKRTMSEWNNSTLTTILDKENSEYNRDQNKGDTNRALSTRTQKRAHQDLKSMRASQLREVSKKPLYRGTQSTRNKTLTDIDTNSGLVFSNT